jgi:hypothetical protein
VQTHLLEEAAIDIKNQFEMAGQQRIEQVQIPRLESLR